MIEWIQNHETVLWWLAAASILVFSATLIVVPTLIVRVPADYFVRKRRTEPWVDHHHPVVRAILVITKNVLGFVLVVAGIIMLVLPGQGIFTILIGITLLNFPGKYQLERWIVLRRPVLRSINWLRRRAGRPPLIVE
ncbi:MAG: PGPGW domain-containing protein [Sulfuricaulis sp.]|nr:PGPGW domain-containing protein [Sulfuricaulis sp.]